MFIELFTELKGSHNRKILVSLQSVPPLFKDILGASSLLYWISKYPALKKAIQMYFFM